MIPAGAAAGKNIRNAIWNPICGGFRKYEPLDAQQAREAGSTGAVSTQKSYACL